MITNQRLIISLKYLRSYPQSRYFCNQLILIKIIILLKSSLNRWLFAFFMQIFPIKTRWSQGSQRVIKKTDYVIIPVEE